GGLEPEAAQGGGGTGGQALAGGGVPDDHRDLGGGGGVGGRGGGRGGGGVGRVRNLATAAGGSGCLGSRIGSQPWRRPASNPGWPARCTTPSRWTARATGGGMGGRAAGWEEGERG